MNFVGDLLRHLRNFCILHFTVFVLEPINPYVVTFQRDLGLSLQNEALRS